MKEKSEIRNPKQIRMTENPKCKTDNRQQVWKLQHPNFRFVSDFGFRISLF